MNKHLALGEWLNARSAPRDGSWFFVLKALRIDDGSAPVLSVLRREGNGGKNSQDLDVPSSMIEGGLWAPLKALPLAELYQLAAPAYQPLPEGFDTLTP